MQQVASKKILIMAGGTGGHVFPALALAKELRLRGCEVQWLGTSKGIEARLVPEHDIQLNQLTITGVRGKGLVTLALAPFKLLHAIYEAVRVLKEFQPNVVVGMGGYASGPGGIAAWMMRIPLLIHEQNAVAGTTNKWLSGFAKRVLTAFPDVLPKGEYVGNPIRQEIINIAAPDQRLAVGLKSLKILVLGGSLGAQALNELIPKTVAAMQTGESIEIKHQTGARHLDSTLKIYNQCKLKAEVLPFIEEMADVLAWADLVICRSGALTVSELSSAGVASILVPFPYAIDDHQTANARWLADNNAAFLKQQVELTEQVLKEMIQQFLDQPELKVTMAKAARALSKPDATRICAEACLELANG